MELGRLVLVGFVHLGVFALAGCGIGNFFAEREPWRLEAEVQCIEMGSVKEGAGIVRVKAIRGPGMCGADYPLRVSALGESMTLGYAGEVHAPPGGHHHASLRERPLGSIRHPQVTGSVTPVAVKPAATLACPMVSELERWIAGSVQPAAMRWFGMPVTEIKQISAYSCRGMNGNPRARISEHAFGNALDIASFTLADGRIITVRDGWHGLPEEQGFLRDIQGSACNQFNTVLAPGSNVFHYDHIHVDLMRRRSGDRACNPDPVAGEAIAARAGARYAKRGGDPFATGALAGRPLPPKQLHAHGVRRERALPVAEPGDDGEDDD